MKILKILSISTFFVLVGCNNLWIQPVATEQDIAQDLNEGLAAYNRNDYTTALSLWKPRAEQGNATAQNYIGNMYSNGIGVTKDEAEAVKWYRKSSDQNNAYGQGNLAIMYENGRGINKDETEAIRLYELALSNPTATDEVKQYATNMLARIKMGTDPTLACTAKIGVNGELKMLQGKVVFTDVKIQPLDILANSDIPTKKERKVISIWVDERNKCNQLGEGWRNQYLPPTLVSLINSFNSDELFFAAELYGGKLTYGNFANKRAKRSMEYQQAWSKEIQQITQQQELLKQQQEIAERTEKQQQAIMEQQKEAAERQRKLDALDGLSKSLIQYSDYLQRQTDRMNGRGSNSFNCTTYQQGSFGQLHCR